jgi:hypothetical protein
MATCGGPVRFYGPLFQQMNGHGSSLSNFFGRGHSGPVLGDCSRGNVSTVQSLARYLRPVAAYGHNLNFKFIPIIGSNFWH